MKKLLGLLVGLTLVLSFTSCDKDNNDPVVEPTLQEQLIASEWMVVYLSEYRDGVEINGEAIASESTYFISFTNTNYSMYQTSIRGIEYSEDGYYTIVDGNVITTTHPNFGVMTFVVDIVAEDEIILTQDLCGSVIACNEGETWKYVWTLNLVTE